MRRSELKAFLSERAEAGKWTVTAHEFNQAFPASDLVQRVMLSRHVKAGLISRLSPGIFLNNDALALGRVTLQGLAGMLRPHDDCYISLDAALHMHGRLVSMPSVVTVMTTGRRYLFDTPLGVVQFIRSKRDPSTWKRDLSDVQVNGIPVASIKLALDDYVRVGQTPPELGLSGPC